MADIRMLLRNVRARAKVPAAIVLGRHQTTILEAELRPYMQHAHCEHMCDLTCILKGCQHVHTPDEEWEGIDRAEAATLWGVSLRYVDDESLLKVECNG